jgi:hypothetical protein
MKPYLAILVCLLAFSAGFIASWAHSAKPLSGEERSPEITLYSTPQTIRILVGELPIECPEDRKCT